VTCREHFELHPLSSHKQSRGAGVAGQDKGPKRKVLKMWEIEISNISIEPRRVPARSIPSVLPPSPTATHPFFLRGQKHSTIRVGSTRACMLGTTSRRVSRVRNVIAGHTRRLHHTKSELLDELANRGLVDQITRWVTNNLSCLLTLKLFPKSRCASPAPAFTPNNVQRDRPHQQRTPRWTPHSHDGPFAFPFARPSRYTARTYRLSASEAI